MSTPSRQVPYCHHLDDSLCKLGRALAGGNLSTISKLVLAHNDLREQILLRVIEMIDRECACLCQRAASPPSIFRKIPIKSLAEFQWSGCIDELLRKAPVLLRVFSKIVSSNDHRNQQKRGDRHQPGICTAIAVLLKERNREMNGLQRMLSLVLFTSRVQKQV